MMTAAEGAAAWSADGCAQVHAWRACGRPRGGHGRPQHMALARSSQAAVGPGKGSGRVWQRCDVLAHHSAPSGQPALVNPCMCTWKERGKKSLKEEKSRKRKWWWFVWGGGWVSSIGGVGLAS